MTNSNNPRQGQFETPFDHIHDVNELVLAARADWIAKSANPAVPMNEETAEDAAMDFVFSLLTGWIIMRAQPPIDSKERMTQIIDEVVGALRRIQSALPEDQAELRRDLLHMLRRQLVRRG